MNIKEIKKKNGNIVYRASVYLGVDVMTGKKIQTNITAKTKKSVKEKAKQAAIDFDCNGSTRLKNVDFKTFEDLALNWWENNKIGLKASTIVTKQNYIYNYIIPAFGKYKINKLNTRLIQTQVNIWASNANNSKRGTLGATKQYDVLLAITRAICKYGKAIGAITDNPANDVILPKRIKAPKKDVEYFDTEILKRWYSYLDKLPNNNINYLQVTIYKLLLATGLRIGEALALSWSDINFDKNELHVGNNVDDDGNLVDTPKTESSVRDVTFDIETALMLRLYHQQQNLIFRKARLSSNNIVFSDDLGTHFKPGKVRARLKSHLIKFGIYEIGMSFHIFRHTHASILLNNGVGYKEISERLGHADIKITMNLYGHLSKENASKVALVFGEYQKTIVS